MRKFLKFCTFDCTKMAASESVTSETRSSDTETKLDCFQVNFNKWYFPKKHDSIGYRVKLTNHSSPCDCPRKFRRNGTICPLLYYCTCYQYTCENMICVHIKQINEIREETPLTRLQRFQIFDIDLENILLDLELDDETFDYAEYFNNLDNFNLNVRIFHKKFLWRGYEWMMVRHFQGLNFSEKDVERIGQNLWRVMEATNKTTKEFRISISDMEKKCVICRPYEICAVCDACHHKYICSCEDHRSGFSCRHGHAVAIKTLPLGAEPVYFLRNEGLYIRNADSRHYFLNMHMRIRHNIGFSMTSRIKSNPDNKSKYGINDNNSFLVITKIKKPYACSCNELHKCHVCQICYHQYSCECPDYQNNYICVHIHATHLALTIGHIKSRSAKMLAQKSRLSQAIENKSKQTARMPATHKAKIYHMLVSVQSKLQSMIKYFQEPPSNLEELSTNESPNQSPSKYKEVCEFINNEQFINLEGSSHSTQTSIQSKELEENNHQQAKIGSSKSQPIEVELENQLTMDEIPQITNTEQLITSEETSMMADFSIYPEEGEGIAESVSNQSSTSTNYESKAEAIDEYNEYLLNLVQQYKDISDQLSTTLVKYPDILVERNSDDSSSLNSIENSLKSMMLKTVQHKLRKQLRFDATPVAEIDDFIVIEEYEKEEPLDLSISKTETVAPSVADNETMEKEK